MIGSEHLFSWQGLERKGHFLPPLEPRTPLPVLAGDRLRLLIAPGVVDPGVVLRDRLLIVAASRAALPALPTRLTDLPGAVALGEARRQRGSTQFALRVAPPDGATYRQATLNRVFTGPDGTRQQEALWPTFYSQQTEAGVYMATLADHLERYAPAPCRVQRDGDLLHVTLWHTAEPAGPYARFSGLGFHLGAGLEVGLGIQRRPNTNTPRLSRTELAPITLPQRMCYQLSYSGFSTGNILTLNGVRVTREENETLAGVFARLGADAAGCFTMPLGQTPTVSALAGQRTYVNETAAQLVYRYVDTVTEAGVSVDRYALSLSGELLMGNAFSVSGTAPGGAALARQAIATADDGATSVLARLVDPDTLIRVVAGSALQVRSLPGRVFIDNDEPQFSYRAVETLPASTTRRVSVLVGEDIQPGNTYRVGSAEYIAQTGDTPAFIAEQLGFSAHPFVVSWDGAAADPTIYALRGWRETEAGNTALWTVEGERETGESPDWLNTITLPATLTPGEWVPFLVAPETGHLLSIGTPLQALVSRRNTLLLRVGWGDNPERHYWPEGPAVPFEWGVSQQLRVWAWVDAPRQPIQEDQYSSLSGQRVSYNLRVREQITLRTGRLTPASHRGLLRLLKHPSVWLRDPDTTSPSGLAPRGWLGVSGAGEAYGENNAVGTLPDYTAKMVLTITPPPRLLRPGSVGASRVSLIDPYGPVTVKAWLVAAQSGDTVALRAGSTVTAGSYRLLVETPASEGARLGVWVNHLLRGRYVGGAGSVLRSDWLRLEPGDLLTLQTLPAEGVTLGSGTAPAPAEAQQPGNLTTVYGPLLPDFTNDLNNDFNSYEL